jgi:hypothetical protein
MGPHMRLETRDSVAVATALFAVPPPRRHPTLKSCLLQVVHALNLPVSFGVNHVTRSQPILWCCQHAICALECAIFLSKWLESIAAVQAPDSLERKSKSTPPRFIREKK